MIKKISQTLLRFCLITLQLLLVSASPLASFFNLDQQVQANYKPDWGVLAINTDQSIYSQGETTHFYLSALDELGNMACDAQMVLEIITPSQKNSVLSTKDNTITKNPECYKKDLVTKPDFEATYASAEVGRYQLKLTAETKDGTYTIEDSYQVVHQKNISVIHNAPTRIFPKRQYPVTLIVQSKKDFRGMIELKVPSSFEIINPEGVEPFSQGKLVGQEKTLRWFVTMKKDEEKKLQFEFDAPDKSPEYYTFSPVKIQSAAGRTLFEEKRDWQIASDATFSVQTGYYLGTGVDSRAITGVGFQPELLLLKDSGINGTDGTLWKSSTMTGEVTAKMADAEADIATDAIQSLDSDGFTLGTNADVNGANVRFTWIAFRGSDCTSSGTLCVGSYTGNGTSQSLTSVGFQPDLVFTKRSGATGGVFATSSMAATNSTPIGTANVVTTAITSLDATGFSVGNNNFANTNANTYWFFAFKTTSGAFKVGTFTGNGTSQSVTSMGFTPNSVFVKNSNATTPAATFYNSTENYGDQSLSVDDATAAVGSITSIDSDGFSVGANAPVNENTKTMYWFAFGGAAAITGASGTYSMAVGSYTGNGTSQSVTGLAFSPDLVLIKHADQATDQYAVFTTSFNAPDTTFYFANAVATFTGGITAITSDGFSVGADATVNTNADTFYWQAFGNAWDPSSNTGAANFSIGSYNGNGIDSRNITRIPFQPDFVAIKSNAGASGVFRTSSQSGDLSVPFGALAEAADYVQALNSDGFQIGTNSRVNNSSSTNYYIFFTFKTGPNFKVGTYSGTGATQSITSPNIESNLIWIKGTSTTGAMLKPSTLAGDSTQYFANTANVTGRITSIDTTGFSLGTGTEVNASGTDNYRYVAWKIPTTYTQNDFEWFVTADSVTLTNSWPDDGGTDIAENTAITLVPATNRPLGINDKIRIQMNFTVGGSRMGASQQAFKLQYSADTNCTTAVTWTDVGAKASGSIWRLFDESSIGDSTTQVNQISTSNSGAEGYYSEINTSAVNPLTVASGNISEWDWPVQNNGAADATSYCFRMVLSDGTILNTYNSDSYPKLYTAPATASLMRHGNFFDSNVEQGFFWAN